MSQQGPILVVSTARRPSFAATLDLARLFPVVETEWADAVRAVEQVQPAAVLAATVRHRCSWPCGAGSAGCGTPALSAADRGRPAGPASRQRHSLLSEPNLASPELADPNLASPNLASPRRLRPPGGPPACRAARAVVACDRDAPAGAGNADGAVGYRSGARRYRAADRPRRRLSDVVGRAWRAHRRGRRALDRGGCEASQRQGHRRHRARRRFQPARDRRLPHRADGGRPVPQPSRRRDGSRSGAGLRPAEPRGRLRRRRPGGRNGAAADPPACLRSASEPHAEGHRRRWPDRRADRPAHPRSLRARLCQRHLPDAATRRRIVGRTLCVRSRTSPRAIRRRADHQPPDAANGFRRRPGRRLGGRGVCRNRPEDRAHRSRGGCRA